MKRDDILDLYRRHGGIAYEGEGITQLQHAWQCGRLARDAGASLELQLASWLHDVGHLMSGLAGTPTLRGFDDTHEATGARALRTVFGSAVSQPVALHVEAKRYLVTCQPGYAARLSPDSTRSLALQGGPMTVEEAAVFDEDAYAAAALRLRVWDDMAKVAGRGPANAEDALLELDALMGEVLAAR